MRNFLDNRNTTRMNAQHASFFVITECARPLCTKLAEFVTSGTEGYFGSEHICYEHAKDEPDAVRCLCHRAAMPALA
ncbi:MAG: hypothetical protein OXD31_17055 [Chloroflexi bacterium]|nr:hypothetical protein [Chloroflexota bacterium]